MASLEEFENLLSDNQDLIVKPLDAMQDRGVHKVSVNEIKEKGVEKVFKDYQSENVLLEEVIKQHPQMVFNNSSVNTIRMFTLIDGKGEVKILKTILRCGIGKAVIDNFCNGGVIYDVDVETGLIDSAGMSENGGKNLLKHPYSNEVMIGRQIPTWSLVKEQCTKAARLISECRFVGWDIAITETGVEFIEGNHDPDPEFLEYIGNKKCFWRYMKNNW